ncbi:DUF4163 domain-containing protein [Nibribacter ruber]|uniref:DUF4163 domain-containing protein n=1 Tax=Nibribacter ruber TaxID=2698458 RepID=A0A6P1NWC4_9BACT|nr:DUF3298 and DUF4163 domain-containing protein [Nibribacter ruber]QHL88007.1 DUF4163 domain-containing protein [Nibribacter ruber]
MKKYLSAFLMLLGGLAFSCQSLSNESGVAPEVSATAGAEEAGELTFISQRVNRPEKPCPQDSCAEVKLQYLVAKGEPAALRDSLNRYMQRYLLGLQLMNNPDASLTPREDAAVLVADQFMEQQAKFRKDFPDAAVRAGWYLTVSSKPLHQTDSLVSLQIKHEGYSGGAHGYAMTTLQTFDNTGHALKITELVTDTVQLRKLVEQEFRKVRKLPATSFRRQGFYTQRGRLPFPQNAALTLEGLLLYYNAYEVNAYAFGPTQLVLPYAQLQTLLKPAYLPREPGTR